ncbi:Tol-Pal system beta propeller repeat protein TolB [Desulfobacterales bacterium HSG16]|nr:Tol-Pal system beta propeller repeat protein TolB [Desulfobacterales bacterium HSG16]
MKKNTIIITGTAIFFFLFCFPFFAMSAGKNVITINPFLRKMPIAVPHFKSVPDNAELSENCAAILSDTLEFTGYFKILKQAAFPDSPHITGKIDSVADFGQWTAIGADYLITGGIKTNGKLFEMELRLFDTVKQTMLIGKRYKGWTVDREKTIRRFCSEVIHHLTGSWGFFDSRIAFVSNGTGNKEIYTCDFNGKSIKKFTTHKSITLTPSWSSDAKWLAYTSYAKGNPDIYIKKLRDKYGSVFSRNGTNATPAWVPGKFMLAASLSFSGDQDIYLLTGKGKLGKRLTRKWGIDTSPAFSPDGTKMAFVSSRAGSPQIYIYDMRSGKVERLTFDGRYNTQPDWSPKGNEIVYSALNRSRIDICVIGVNGRNMRKLTRNSGKNESPSWAPDGSMIVFSSNREGPNRIYIMTAFGTDQRRLLVLPGQQSSPAWSPRLVQKISD